jgi:FtsZ-interacting cell division protein YlmF
MARRILNRRDLRAANDAAERREAEAEEEEDREDEEEDEESDETEDEGDAEAGDEDEDEEEAKPKKKAKKKAVAKAPAKRKARGSKSVRMKVVWGVFNNSNARVQTFEYSKRAEAQALADKLTTEKKSTHFVNPVKEPMEDKKED